MQLLAAIYAIISDVMTFVVRYEGLLLSVGGNGRSYIIIFEAGPTGDTSQSKLYFVRISTKAGFCRVSFFLCDCWCFFDSLVFLTGHNTLVC